MRISQNIAAFNAYRNLNQTQTRLTGSLEKLSSGLRINRAADDASGLVRSESMRAQIGGLRVSIRNAQDAVGLVQTSEGALNEVHAMLQRMRDLAVSAANEPSTGAAEQAEVTRLLAEVEAIATRTSFAGRPVFADAAGPSGVLLEGVGGAQDAGRWPGSEISAFVLDDDGVGVGSDDWPSLAGHSIRHVLEYDRDGDTVSVTFDVPIDEGPQAYRDAFLAAGRQAHAEQLFQSGEEDDFEFRDELPLVHRLYVTHDADAIGSIQLTSVDMTLIDGDDGTVDPLPEGVKLGAFEDEWDIGEFIEGVNFVTLWSGDTGIPPRGEALLADELPDNVLVPVQELQALLAAGDLGVRLTIDDDVLGDVRLSSAAAAGDELEAALARAGLGDDYTVLVWPVAPGSEEVGGIFLQGTVSAPGTVKVELVDLTGVSDTVGDGTSIFQVGAGSGERLVIDTPTLSLDALGIDGLSVTDDDAISRLDTAIETVSSQRAALGAFQNRLESTIRNLSVTVENLSAAESRIRDTDMAMEMVEFTRNQILSQAGTAMLSQANIVPQSVLALLG